MEALKEFWNFFLDWPNGTIMTVIAFLATIGPIAIIVWIVGAGILSAINSWFMSKKNGFGEVIDKKIRPRVREMGGVIEIPAAWLLTLKVGEKTGDASVPKECFDSLNQGDKVSLVYTLGRIYNGLNIKKIEIAN